MSRIYNILNTLINKVQFKVMSQTIGGETTVEGCLSALNSKINLAYSAATNIGAFEQSICKIGQFVVGSIIFRPTADISADNGLIATISDISVTNAFQLPLICIAGTQAGETGRVMIYQDTIRAWYSNVQPKKDNTYLIPIIAITNL